MGRVGGYVIPVGLGGGTGLLLIPESLLGHLLHLFQRPPHSVKVVQVGLGSQHDYQLLRLQVSALRTCDPAAQNMLVEHEDQGRSRNVPSESYIDSINLHGEAALMKSKGAGSGDKDHNAARG